MQEGLCYIKDSHDFMLKTKILKSFPKDALLVIADGVGLYPSIPFKADLRSLREALHRRSN